MTTPLTFAPRKLSIDRRADGTLILSSPIELGKCDWRITEFLPIWASAAPDRVFLAQRGAKEGWDEITYGQAWSQVQAVGQSLIEMGAKPGDRLAVLSGNSIENAVISFAAAVACSSVCFSLSKRVWLSALSAIDSSKLRLRCNSSGSTPV